MTCVDALQVFQGFQFGEFIPRNIWSRTKWVIWHVSNKDTVPDYHGQILSSRIAAHFVSSVRANTNALRAIIEGSDVGDASVSNRIGIRKERASIPDNLSFNGFGRRNTGGNGARVILRRSRRAAPQADGCCGVKNERSHAFLHVGPNLTDSENGEARQPVQLALAGVVVDFARDAGTGGGRSAQDRPKIGFSKECA